MDARFLLLLLLSIFFWCAEVSAQIWAKPRTVSVKTPTSDGSEPQNTAAPHGMRLRHGRLYVALKGENAIGIYQGDSFSPVARWPINGSPLDIVFTRNGWLVSDFSGTRLIRLKHHNGVMSGAIELGAAPSLFTTISDARTVIVSEKAEELAIYDHELDVVVSRIKTGKQPYPAAVTQNTERAFIPLKGESGVEVLSLISGERIAFIDECKAPEGGDLVPGDRFYLVACGGDNKVMVIDAATYKIQHHITEGIGERPFSVVVEPTGRYAFVNNAGGKTVSVISLQTFEVVHRIKTGAQPIVMRVFEEKLYISNEKAGTLTIQKIPAPLHRPKVNR